MLFNLKDPNYRVGYWQLYLELGFKTPLNRPYVKLDNILKLEYRFPKVRGVFHSVPFECIPPIFDEKMMPHQQQYIVHTLDMYYVVQMFALDQHDCLTLDFLWSWTLV